MNAQTLSVSLAVAMAVIAPGTVPAVASDTQQQLHRVVERNVKIRLQQPCVVAIGDNPFQVVVENADGTALEDVTVSVHFVMAGWPIKRIPETRTTLDLHLAGNGEYTGVWNVSRPGPWQTTIVVKRSGAEIGRRGYVLIAY